MNGRLRRVNRPERPIDAMVKKTLADLYKRKAELEATIGLLEGKQHREKEKQSGEQESEQ